MCPIIITKTNIERFLVIQTMAEQKFFSDDEMKSLRFMMEEQKCTPDEIEIMISRIRGDIREYYISKEVQHILLVSLDYDLCSAILTILFEDLFPNKVSAILQRLKMYDHYFQSGFVEKAMKIARNLERDIRTRVEAFKKKHPNGKVFGVNGSFRQDFSIDISNRENHNDPETVGTNYYEYNGYFKGVIPSGNDSLICVDGGDLDYIFKFLDIEYKRWCYADGDGKPGCSHGRYDMTVDNNRPKNLKNALGKRIKKHKMNKKGLVECHLAKANKEFPGANIEMVFYDDVKDYLKSIKEIPLRDNESVKTINFVGWPDSDVPEPVEVFV